MIGANKDRLYNLLPAVYRMADARHGKPLRALLRVIEEEMNALEMDIDGLYDDWFIETCADWVIPYIGDLIGIERLQYLTVGWNLRSYVANALNYRRRKGTASVLEKVARDVTGWPAHSLEFFRLTIAAQNLKHLRPFCLQSPHLRDSRQMDSLEGPFGIIPHTADLRKIEKGQGIYNISNVGIYLWRLNSYEVNGADARFIDEGCYTFDPAGFDVPLFNQPKNNGIDKILTDESDFPGPIRCSHLCRHVRGCQLRPDHQEFIPVDKSPYFSRPPVISIKLDLEMLPGHDGSSNEMLAVPVEDLKICDLSSWKDVGQSRDPRWKIAIDPQLGRLMISEGMFASLKEKSQKIRSVLTSYSYGFFGDIGAGPYDRTSAVREFIEEGVCWQSAVVKDKADFKGMPVYSTLTEAIGGWNDYVKSCRTIRDGPMNGDQEAERKVGLIAIMDSRTYHEDVTIEVFEGSLLLIVAAAIPSADEPTEKSSEENRHLLARMQRPHLLGNMKIRSAAPEVAENPGEMVINGLLIEGDLMVQSANLRRLIISNSTIVPGKGALKTNSQDEKENGGLEIILNRTICGRIKLAESVPKLLITECIIDAKSSESLAMDLEMDPAIDAEGTQVSITESTIIGRSCMSSLMACDSIFTGLLSVRQKQVGYAKFCYLPSGSKTPRRFQCQPDAFIDQESERIIENSQGSHDVLISQMHRFVNRIHPAFNSLRYPNPAYAQLSGSCPIEISAGAEDGSEMGAFKSLHQPQRLANLKVALEEYLPFELEAGIFFIS
jgi:hypothetical protein